jgi:hypothetical protein
LPADVKHSEFGCANNYTYAFGDPINHPELNGQGLLDDVGGFFKGLYCTAKRNWRALTGIPCRSWAQHLSNQELALERAFIS